MVLVGGYLLLHLLIRLLFSGTLQLDDAEQIRLSQTLALGYPIPQPPLYSWFSWGLFQLLGSGLLALTLLKYLLIGLTFGLIWRCSSYLFHHQSSRWLATLALLLMPSFAWHMHQGFTHTILLGLAIVMTLHALLRLPQHPSPVSYLYLGSALGIGLLAKYSFLLLMIPLLLSALTIRSYRHSLLQPRLWITLTTVALWVTPHLVWLSQHQQEVFSSIEQKLQVTQENLLLGRLSSLWQFTTSAIAFVTPWALLYVLLSGKQLLASRGRTPSHSTQLLSRFYWIVLIAVILLSLFFSMPHFKVRWFHPLMMLFPLWWLTRMEISAPPSATLIRWVGWSTLLLSLLILSIRIVQVTVGPELGHYSRLNRPIFEGLEQLPPPSPSARLKTEDEFLGAHLLAHYPNHSIMIGMTLYQRGAAPGERCLLFWDNDDPFPPPDLTHATLQKNRSLSVGKVQYGLNTVQLPYRECQ
jgi:lipopolysaccharide core galacturonosyltransferase RgtB